MQKPALRVALAALTTAAFLAQPDQTRAQEVAPTIRGDMNTMAAKGLLAERDDDFVKHAARLAALEIQTGTLAMKKSSNAELKTLAEKLVSDHTAIAKDLAQWATKNNIVLKDDDPDLKIKMNKHAALQTKAGADFDRDFLDAMIDDHRDAIVLFSNESRNTKDVALKALADQILPKIRAFLNTARNLRAKI